MTKQNVKVWMKVTPYMGLGTTSYLSQKFVGGLQVKNSSVRQWTILKM